MRHKVFGWLIDKGEHLVVQSVDAGCTLLGWAGALAQAIVPPRTIIQRVDINVTSNQDPAQIARLTVERLREVALRRRSNDSPND